MQCRRSTRSKLMSAYISVYCKLTLARAVNTMATTEVSKDSSAPHWDTWYFTDTEHENSTNNVPNSTAGSSTVASVPQEKHPQKSPHVKESRMWRSLSRESKQEEFLGMDVKEQIQYCKENQKINDEKNKKAQEQKWHKSEDGRWENWNGKWYWMEWKYQQRWLGPY